MRIPLTGGAYEARSIIANAQRSVNLFPERNPEPDDAPVPVTQYLTPGLTLLATLPVPAPGRGMYRASNGSLYYAAGATLYSVAPNWALTALGPIAASNTIVSMSDNGVTLVAVDGSPNGYQVTLGTNGLSPITDPNFLGSVRCDFMDTFLLFDQPGTANFFISQSDAVTFDGTDVVQKNTYPDPLVGVIELHNEVWLIGTLTTEIWYNAGAALFPFQQMPGVFIEHGCLAPYSICKQDTSVFWLGADQQGQAIVFEGIGYTARRISTHAIEDLIQGFPSAADAIGFTYQQDGHVFYFLTFPTGDRTLVYDKSIGLWHERAWLDGNGDLHRHRANCGCSAYGSIVVGDWQNGNLYALDLNNYTDNGNPIPRIRSFPHIVEDGDRIFYDRFIADMDVGEILGATTDSPPQISLRWSDTKGRTWSNAVEQSLGSTGEFDTNLQWRRLGYARDRVFELSWSAQAKTALNGAFVEVRKAGT